MKKICLLINFSVFFFIVHIIDIYALIPTFYYESTIVYTHHGSEVNAITYTSDYTIDQYVDVVEFYYGNQDLSSFNYLQATTITCGSGTVTTVAGAKVSTLYNCHSFALHFKGEYQDITTSNSIWISDPTSYYTDGSLLEITMDNAKAGDIVLYMNNGNYSHSGIVMSVPSGTKTLDNIVVRSKDGSSVLADHKASEPFSYKNDDTIVRFYRWNHQGEITSKNAFSHTIDCTYCVESIQETHRNITSGNKYICLICGFISKFEIITPDGVNILYRYASSENEQFMTYSEMYSYLINSGDLIAIEEFFRVSAEAKASLDVVVPGLEVS